VPDHVLPLDPDDVDRLIAVTSAGGIVLFPAEGVYGLAVDPRRPDAVRRLAELKGRDPEKPVAVLFWSVDDVLADGTPGPAIPRPATASEAPRSATASGTPRPVDPADRIGRAVRALLPGPVGLVLPDPAARFPAAAGTDPTSLGVRAPRLAGEAPPGRDPIAQTSANRAGEPDPVTVDAVPRAIRAACDLVLDRGPRPGTPSTIVDLRAWAAGDGRWRVLREGAVPGVEIDRRLGALRRDG